MKIRAFVVSVLIASGIATGIFYAGAVRPSTDQKAIAEAIQTRNTPVLIQSLISKMKNQLEKDDGTFPELIREVETYTQVCTDSASAAILHSMTAEMYNHYYILNRWTIDQRTQLSGYIPEDIREWTANLFTAKVKEELAASLRPAPLLQQTPVDRYKDILITGESSATLRPTLYDFLIFRAIDLQPSDSLYQEMLAFRRTRPDRKALLIDELDYLRYRYEQSPALNRNQYEASLDSLTNVYAGQDISNEIRIAQVALLQQTPYPYPRNAAAADSIKALQYMICKEGIALYPDYKRTGSLKNTLHQLTRPQMNTEVSKTVYPGKDLQLKLQYTNVPQVTVRIYHSLLSPEAAGNIAGKQKNPGQLVKEVNYTLSAPAPYAEADTTLSIPMDQPGLYECVVTARNNGTEAFQITDLFAVSRLATVHRSTPQGEREVWVTDYQTGRPVEKATVTYYRQTDNQLIPLGTTATDKDGLATLPRNKQISAYRATLPDDTKTFPTFVYPQGIARPETETTTRLSLFTDRGIYRPGQTVFFKGIAYDESIDNPHVLAGQTFTVSFRDANNKEIANKKYTTNRFGSFNGEFSIPKQGLSGTFTLVNAKATAFIRVEEYKRPTFEVEIEPLTAEASFGHPISIRGKAETYSGVALQEGQISWRIDSRPFWYRGDMYGYFNYSTEQVANGTARVDDTGNFLITFTPEKNANGRPAYQSYEVVATLTDSKGETQEARYTFSVGDTGILLSIVMPEKMDKSEAQVQVNAQTVNGQAVPTQGTFSLTNKTTGQIAASGKFDSGKPFPATIFDKLPSAAYRMEVMAADKQGQTVKASQEVVLFDKRDKRPPVFSPVWLINEKVNCLPGEDANILFGTSEKKASVLYEIYSNNKCIERKLIEMNDENRTFRIPFEAGYGEGIIVSFSFVKDGKLYVAQVPVERTQPDRRLTIRTETFRDHLLPGTKENWKFRLLDADSAAVSAEVLAGMYDASLDQLMPFGWSFRPVAYIGLQAPRFTEGNGFGMEMNYGSAKVAWLTIPEYTYDRLNWQGMLDGGFRNRPFYSTRSAMAGGLKFAPMAKESALMADNALAEEQVMSANADNAAGLSGQSPAASAGKLPIIRSNFAETAFFYPALVTDASGDVSFGFTLPESNTTWKLQLLAQTEDLKYGTLSREIVSSKPLMVLPNLPRFMREGDQVTISTQIINQSDKEINGRIRLELFDPENDQPVVCLTKSQRPFTLQADSIGTAQWTLPVPANISLIGCRIVAESDHGSDGEQHLIPILSNQLLITESIPFYLSAEETEKQIPTTGSTGTKPFRYTLELTANPVWYAVQALPTLTEPQDNNVLSAFASYYSNTLASHIARSHPRIRQVINQWTAAGGDASTLFSSLQKNEELKTILLEETPWVLAAANETEQKQRLATLFDLNRAAGQRQAALQRMLEAQNPDGGWSWFKGFPASRDITLSILKGMAQLVQMNAVEYGEQEKRMQINALNYLDKRIEDDYKQLPKAAKERQKIRPDARQIEYLYVRSSYRDIPEAGGAREAIRFYTAQTAAAWSKESLKSKAEIALLMHRNGQKEVAGQIITWLRKTATTSATKGMYWANNRSGSDFLSSPVDTHCLLMAALHEIAPQASETDRMKQWLLNQKQTQSWPSTPSTLNAIYALLLTGSDWLAEDNTCTASWGDKSWSTATGGSAALGYIQEIIPQSEIKPSMQTVVIRKEGRTPAWGAVYSQYFQTIDKVTGEKGALNVEKKLFIERNSGSGLQISPLAEGQTLHVGDKVTVRLVVRADRNMDYVVLKDLRAGCFEPQQQLSGAAYQDGVWFYRSPEDVSENFFFEHLPQGTFVLEYGVYVVREGDYSGGISTIQCLYAPQFVSHTEGTSLQVAE